MRKARIFLGLGIWIAVLPYLGFPHSWKTVLYTVSGLVLVYLGYAMYQGHKKLEAKERTYENFRESSPLDTAESE